MLNDKSLRRKLNSYSKKDIIDALCEEFEADYHIKRLLITLNEKDMKRAISNEEKAFDEVMKATDEYDKWVQKMVYEYGDGRSVCVKSIPEKEIKRGAMLSNNMNSARHNATIAMTVANRAHGITKKENT